MSEKRHAGGIVPRSEAVRAVVGFQARERAYA
jgi:hypothetical protein